MPTFNSPYFLIALVLAGLPIAIHFLTKPKPKIIRYPTFHLLMAAGSGKQALHRLRTLLLLTSRLLAISALIFVFAGPRLESSDSKAIDETTGTPIALLLDGSMSMTGVRDGVSLFEESKARAAEVLRHLDSSSPVTIILVKSKPEQLLPAPSRNHAALHQHLATASPSLEKANPDAALALATQLLHGRGKIYIFSDFQRSDWSGVGYPQHPELSIILHPITTSAISNVGIVSLDKAPVKPVLGEPVELSCTLFNSSTSSRLETVYFDLPGISGSTEVELPPFGTGTASHTFTLPQEGCAPGTVRLRADNLEADNTHYFEICAQNAVNAPVVSNSKFDDPRHGAFFISKALNPFTDSNPSLRVANLHGDDLDRNELETGDVFFLVPPLKLSRENIDNISRRVLIDGAALVVVTHDSEINTLLEQFSPSPGDGLSLPYTMTPPLIPDFTVTGLTGLQASSGLLDFLNKSGHQGLASITFQNHFQTMDRAQRETEILLRHTDGSAALSLSAAGRGSLVGINMGLSPEDGNLVSNPLFPVMIQEIVTMLRNKNPGESIHPGNALTFSINNRQKTDNPDSFTIIGPEGKQIEPELINGPESTLVRIPSVNLPGHYRLVPSTQIEKSVVVNVDPKECDTRIIPLGELTKTSTDQPATGVSVLTEPGQLRKVEEGKDLWPYFALAAALFLLFEMLLSSFGVRRNQMKGRRS